ncbi:MAG: class I SAM-dependent methyltransferase [candidate division KSB1 bacterium]|nr:class I SAM-dependent methyltransferase [candidate division KSB1 bacterium]MDZ7402002.1 class I SAM-dependent methyltransferase [candidate division KSB1 bacterium]
MDADKKDIWLEYNIADSLQASKTPSILEIYTERAYTQNVMGVLDKYLNKGDRVLDIGCGIGKWVLYLLQKGIDCIGIDSSEVAVEKAQNLLHEKGHKNVIFNYSATELPFDKNRFDGIISFGLLEHFPNHKEVLKYWTEFLKPGGRIVISVPNGLRWDWMFADILFKWYKQKARIKMRFTNRGFVSTNYGYEERWRPDYLARLFDRVGLKKIEITTFYTLSPLIFYSLGKLNIPSNLFHALSSTKASQRWGLYLFGVAEKD